MEASLVSPSPVSTHASAGDATVGYARVAPRFGFNSRVRGGRDEAHEYLDRVEAVSTHASAGDATWNAES